MANDRISGQVKEKDSLAKLTNWFCLTTNVLFAVMWGVLFFMMPWIHSMENFDTIVQSRTLNGRLNLAGLSLLSAFIMAFIPASLSYGFCRLMGLNGKGVLKNNQALQTALTVYVVLILFGVIGAINFVKEQSPLEILGL